MIRKLSVLRILVIGWAAALLPALAWGDPCQQTSVSNLIGTSCTIGDVAYSFGNTAFSSTSVINGVAGSGIDASSLMFTPDASNPLDPSFTISGPLSVTATGLASSTEQLFVLLWAATPTDNSLAFGSATNSLLGATVPGAPSFGFVSAGNNLGDPSFTNAFVETGVPSANPSSTSLDSASTIPVDGLFADLGVADGTGTGATASASGLSYQYVMVPTPEPSVLLLLGSGLLSVFWHQKKGNLGNHGSSPQDEVIQEARRKRIVWR